MMTIYAIAAFFLLWLIWFLGLEFFTRIQPDPAPSRKDLWPGSNADRWPPQSPCTAAWPCDPEDGWICTAHVTEGITRIESWVNHD